MTLNTKNRRSLSELAAAFTQAKPEGDARWKHFFPFWKMPTDSTATVRFLPDANDENPMGFLVENNYHELHINGKKETFGCLKMYGQECPLCALSAHYYDEKSEDHSPEIGKMFYRKKSYLGQVLVIDSPVEHDANMLVKMIEFGPAIFKVMQAAFQSGDLEEAPYELKGGYNFRIKKTKNGEYSSYTTSSFSPKQTDVADDVISSLTLHDLKDFKFPAKPAEVLEVAGMAALNGNRREVVANVKASNEASTPETEAAPQAVAAAPVAAPLPKESSVVAQLKARAAAAKAARTVTE